MSLPFERVGGDREGDRNYNSCQLFKGFISSLLLQSRENFLWKKSQFQGDASRGNVEGFTFIFSPILVKIYTYLSFWLRFLPKD